MRRWCTMSGLRATASDSARGRSRYRPLSRARRSASDGRRVQPLAMVRASSEIAREYTGVEVTGGGGGGGVQIISTPGYGCGGFMNLVG